MRRDFRYHLSHIDNSLYAMSDRGMVFFDEMMRLTRIFDRINSAKVREAFERELSHSTQRIREAIEPYTRFVRTERDKLRAVQQSLDEDGRELRNLAAQIEAL
jgi:hypothetical protein